MKLARQNYIIEKLNLKGNKKVNYTTIEQIETECRKNYLIKQFIAPVFLQDMDHPLTHDCNFAQKRVKELELQNEVFYQTDFIGKFIHLNKLTI